MLTYLLAFLTAQTDPASLPVELTYGDAFTMALNLLGGLKGAGALAIAAAVTQLVMRLLQTPLGQKAGVWRWFAYSGVSLVAGVLALLASGSSLTGALLNAATMTGLGNWLHQLPTQLGKAKQDAGPSA